MSDTMTNPKELRDRLKALSKISKQAYMYTPDQLRNALKITTIYAREATEAQMESIEGNRITRPTIVCLCGSTRFGEAFRKAQLEETLAGNIVLTIGCNMRSDDEIFGYMTEEERAKIKGKLDRLHFRKIDLADEVLILNVGGYIGQSTRNELEYARSKGKAIRFLESEEDS